ARAAAAAARRGEGPVSDVLAVAEQRDGALRKVSSEVVTGARRLADALAGGVEALVVAAGPVQGADQLGGFGADKVITLAHPAFARYAPEGFARVIADRARAGVRWPRRGGRVAGGGGCRLAAARRSGGPDREDGEPHAVHRGRDLRRDPTPRRDAYLEGDRRDQQGQRRADLQGGRLRGG